MVCAVLYSYRGVLKVVPTSPLAAQRPWKVRMLSTCPLLLYQRAKNLFSGIPAMDRAISWRKVPELCENTVYRPQRVQENQTPSHVDGGAPLRSYRIQLTPMMSFQDPGSFKFGGVRPLRQ